MLSLLYTCHTSLKSRPQYVKQSKSKDNIALCYSSQSLVIASTFSLRKAFNTCLSTVLYCQTITLYTTVSPIVISVTLLHRHLLSSSYSLSTSLITHIRLFLSHCLIITMLYGNFFDFHTLDRNSEEISFFNFTTLYIYIAV